MKNGEFIGQTAKEISPEELDTVIEMIKADLKKLSVYVTDVATEGAYDGFFIKFAVDGLNFTSRDRERSLVSPITTITVYFTSQWGFNNSDWDFVSDRPPLDILTMLLTGQTAIQEVLLFPTMKPEKKAPKDPADKYTAIGVAEDIVPIVQKCGYNIVESLRDQNPQKIQQQIGEVINKFKLTDIKKPSVDEIAQWLQKLQ